MLMRRAGCIGINFGVDHGDERMLELLGRNFSPEDIVSVSRYCRDAGIAVMFDLLLGSPGETHESIRRAFELMEQARPDQVGISLGVRVHPGTSLAAAVEDPRLRAGLVSGVDGWQPVFFLEPQVAGTASAFLAELIGEDPRFFFFDPARSKRDYNYNANQRLTEAIKAGHRGAYWDILRRFAG